MYRIEKTVQSSVTKLTVFTNYTYCTLLGVEVQDTKTVPKLTLSSFPADGPVSCYGYHTYLLLWYEMRTQLWC